MQTEQMIRMVNETSTNIRVMAQLIEDAETEAKKTTDIGSVDEMIYDLKDIRKDMQRMRNVFNRLISESE